MCCFHIPAKLPLFCLCREKCVEMFYWHKLVITLYILFLIPRLFFKSEDKSPKMNQSWNIICSWQLHWALWGSGEWTWTVGRTEQWATLLTNVIHAYAVLFLNRSHEVSFVPTPCKIIYIFLSVVNSGNNDHWHLSCDLSKLVSTLMLWTECEVIDVNF